MRSEGIPIPKSQRRASLARLAVGAFLRTGPICKLADLITAVRFVVQGNSMEPNFTRDQYVLVSRMAYLRNGPSRGDVVVLYDPRQQRRNFIKRIIGLPEELIRVEDGHVFINGQLLEEAYLNGRSGYQDTYNKSGVLLYDTVPTGIPDKSKGPSKEWTLGDDQYFVMGDNRANSDDSRSFGPLKRELILGKAWIRYWPLSAWGFLP